MCQLYFCNNVIIPNFLINIVKNRSLSIWLQKFSMIVLRNQFRLDDTHMFILITFQRIFFLVIFLGNTEILNCEKLNLSKKCWKYYMFFMHMLYIYKLNNEPNFSPRKWHF